MKTLILEVDDAIYPKVKGFLDLLPDGLCHFLEGEEPDAVEIETIQSVRAAYRAGREEFDDWDEIRDQL
ncbi:MAG: hypothetical protein KJO08_11495 [Gammaproteobacteria bacterium]|nr:hypothetical protein [Gammaproteobacteria bacterium]NNJ83429.1 hypothetical protein [Gammaproteobacteria bacterium]